MASHATNFPYLYVLVQEHLSHVAAERAEWSRRMRQLNRRYEDALVGIIRDGSEAGTRRATGEPQLMANGLLGMLGWMSRWSDPNDSAYNAADVATTFADTFLSGITT